eukprot:7023029-Lingulodinium_polyedra.AAC.1
MSPARTTSPVGGALQQRAQYFRLVVRGKLDGKIPPARTRRRLYQGHHGATWDQLAVFNQPL